VDFDAQCIRLQASQTKGKKARELPFYGEMEHWLLLQRERCPEGCPWVFFHNSRPVGAQLRGGGKSAKLLVSHHFSFTTCA
jgi:hypothetical protein